MDNNVIIHIIDLDGKKYEINSIHDGGNNELIMIIKKPNESFISHNQGDKLIDEHLGWKPL